MLQIRSRTFDITNYIIDRITRIYPVVIAALLFTFALDALGALYFSSIYYDGSLSSSLSVINANFQEQTSLVVLIGNMVMMQTILVPTFGSNSPLWSLSNEAMYYILGPLLFLVIRRSPNVLALACLLVAFFVLPIHIWMGFVYWLIGAFAAMLVVRGKKHLWLALPVFFAVLFASKLTSFFHQFIELTAISGAFAWVIVGATASETGRTKWVHRWLAGFSFSLYVVHFPMLVLLASVAARYSLFDGSQRLLPDMTFYLGFILIIAIIVLVSWGFSLATESQTPRIRSWFKQKLT